ncbi:RNA binding protein [Aspergillus arachidicola]|uniref:RNA binding protein n=1 Tax=Aspergillus arachidicola TaxID=656916 RepID=A0A2G7G2N7_9EURO|nr:RNA binding protein [Aspergillus arachidicola]
MPHPQKGRSRPRGSDEEFVLFLQGIPAHCRWQELKDLVRQTALHIRQAVVYDDHHGFPTGLGQIIVKNEDEAWRTYHRLSTNGWEGQSLVVTLARTSSPTRPIAGPTKSPHCVIPSDYVAGYSTPPRVSQNMAVPPSPISPEPVIAGTSPTYPPPEYGHVPVMALPHQSFFPIYPDPLSQPMSGIPPSPALRPSYCDPLTFTVYPPYPLHSHSSPHLRPASNGNPRPPPRRTIFIQNLNPATTQSELHSHLQDAGSIESCEVPLDPTTARCKGFARITFHTAEEAKRAIARYNNTIFLNAKIRVKIDRAVPYAASYALTPPVTIVSAPHPPSTTSYTPEHTIITPPRTDESPKSEPTSTTEEASQTKCQPGPLVVNGSGIGRKEITT